MDQNSDVILSVGGKDDEFELHCHSDLRGGNPIYVSFMFPHLQNQRSHRDFPIEPFGRDC